MFLNRLLLMHEPGCMLWRVAKECLYRSQKFDRLVRVPVGFKTDLASVPQALWHIFPPCGPYLEAAVVHDYLYSLGGDSKDRERADAIFLEAMEEIGVSPMSRRLIWAAVRVFGASHFVRRTVNDSK
jgi:hypothetical protein